jgi:hypothetical protein
MAGSGLVRARRSAQSEGRTGPDRGNGYVVPHFGAAGPSRVFLDLSQTSMDSVSRRAQAHQQFNARPPKSGPMSNVRNMELSSRRSTPEVKLPKQPGMYHRSSSASMTSLKQVRPTVTNSRIKNKEDRTRMAYLAFAKEALQNKANVSLCMTSLVCTTYVMSRATMQDITKCLNSLISERSPPMTLLLFLSSVCGS